MAIWFEALPSPANGTPPEASDHMAALQGLQDAGAQRILVPEVCDGPVTTVDNIDFAGLLGDATGLPTACASLVAPRSSKAVDARLDRAGAAGIDHHLLVGRSRRDQPWQGPDLQATLQRHGRGHELGVVTIPGRHSQVSEVQRLAAKQEAGATFAVSQILFDPDAAIADRRELVGRHGRGAIPIVYGLAPVVQRRDISFLRRLGVTIPRRLLHDLENAPARRRQRLAQDVAVQAASALAAAHEDEGLGAHGFCISHVRYGNVEAAIDLLARLRDELGSRQPAPVHAVH